MRNQLLPLIIGITPFEAPDAALVMAIARAGGLGVLDLGRDHATGLQAFHTVAARLDALGRTLGVRVAQGAPFVPADVEAAGVVVLDGNLPIGEARREGQSPLIEPWKASGRTILVQVCTVDEARAALAAGADGLIAKGNESGGRVEDESSYVLLQRIVAELGEAIAIWVQGGVGMHTAAACVAGGARGVVLDAQFALVEESTLDKKIRDALRALDGGETAVVEGRRVLQRPDLPPLAAGQDIGFAKRFADRCKTAGGVVRAVTRAVAGHLRQARELDPLAPDSPLAQELGVHYPIAQGPMTRVSDCAAFAEAVSAAGALPFLALSLMRGAEARTLMTQAAEAHKKSGRSWGVGILGFVPPELRDEQLALIRELHPPIALIAGGRPSQSRPLEDAGIKTFLHVPSPGLLDMFLADGARRFVLEGRECGGHVGPRSSFVLWEGAIERLLQEERTDDLDVLFAGGIHDARSAAMVAACAAPLAARGARIGVLMGTAYLFTKEAVATGAIQPGFQAMALECERTVLLDTAPGHSTRCAESDYVRAFRAERARLTAEGLGHKEIWEALEQLNLGRLRIASKGLVRDDSGLRQVDAEAQLKDGMYMLGQVAALRSGTCTMAELHEDVSAGSFAFLAGSTPTEPARPADVAIVGMAAIFPGAADLDAYWRNIVGGVSSVTEVPPERWNVDLYYDKAGTGDKTPSRWGGFLPEIAFDPAAYGIPPRSLAAIEPVQLLALEVAHRALHDAFAGREFDRERASVIFGAEAGTELSGAYGFRAQHRQFLGELPKELDEKLPKLTEDSFPGVLANVIAGRIANRLDLGGVNYTVDAACASSLAAVDLACKELVSGTSDVVVCGGADLHNGINDYLMFASVHALSPTGQCRPFDAAADGIALGEGVAALVLKRLADAERDGDRIYAVIKSVGGSSDGKSLGLTAPRQEGQMRALERAYARAGVSPADVELVEAHGTGTVVGDRTELATLTEIFGSAGALPGKVTLGSVKSQIGHTKCAAGLAGLIKAALSIHHKVLPPTKNLEKANPGYEGAKSPFVFRDAAHPWPSEQRVAGVSAFGFGGTNFHVVLSNGPTTTKAKVGLSDWPAELFLIRGRSRAEAQAVCAQVLALAESGKPYKLRDLAAGAWAAGQGTVHIAFVAESLADVVRECRAPELAAAADGKIAMLFPGQGSQRAGMLADVMVAFPSAQDSLVLGKRFAAKMYPRAALSREDKVAQATALTDTRVAQPALGIVDLAMAGLLARVGVEGDLLGGHSYGELVALTAAGVFSPADLLALSEARAKCILDAAAGAPGSMAAVRGPVAEVERALGADSGVVMANMNAPDQVVIAGPDDAIERACVTLGAAGLSAKKIPVACAFHSPVVARGAETFAARLADVAVHAPTRPVFANSTASEYPSDPDEIRALLAGQIAKPVRFAEQIEKMYAAGARIFLEAGPGNVLSNLVGRILGDRPHTAIACDRPGEPGVKSFLQALAQLALAGVAVDAAPLFAGRGVRALDLAKPRVVGPPATAWMVNGQHARPLHGELPDFAMKPILTPVIVAHAAPVASEREGTVLEYLRGMRELVEGQKEVMLRFLGSAPEVSAAVQPAVTKVVAPAPVAVAAVAPVAAAPRDPLEVLVGIVSERTGYPKDMLDPDLDLEADLGIDSIKRIEILGTLGEKLGLKQQGSGKRSEMIEELATVKTLRAIAKWIEGKVGGAPAAQAPKEILAEGSTRTIVVSSAAPDLAAGSTVVVPGLNRYVLRLEPLPAAVPNGLRLEGQRFAITDDGRGIANELASLLLARGADVTIVTEPGPLGRVDGLVHLAPLALASVADSRKVLFGLAKEAVVSGAKWLFAATGLGGTFGHQGDVDTASAGIAGLLKSVAREWPALRVRSVDLDMRELSAKAAKAIAQDLLAELLSDDPRVEVGYRSGVRNGLRPELETLAALGTDSLELGPDAVVLVTGGARGITAATAVALASRFGCSLELVGRSPMPDQPEDDELAACLDPAALRRLLVERGARSPVAIEAEVGRILAAREVRRTLQTIGQHVGERIRYHAVDIRDRQAFGAVIDDIYARHGRLDGVIHGAGVIEDRLLRDKTKESFDRVFDTKVEGAVTLLEKLRDDVRFVVFFSSISGAFGNRGQTDYAAANDALDKIAHDLNRRVTGRVVSINWGPWGGTGMISPELEREYERRGIGLIRPDEGVAHLIDEVQRGTSAQVILMRARPEDLT